MDKKHQGAASLLTLACSPSWEPLAVLCRALHFSGGEHPCSIAEIFHYQKPRRQCDQTILKSLQAFLLYFSSDGKKENHKGEGDAQTTSALRSAVHCSTVVSD